MNFAYASQEKKQPEKMSSRSKSASMNQANRLNVIGQSNLKIGQPNDKYEQEADRVAEQIIGMTSPASSRIQRRCASCEDENELLQRKQKYHITPGITPSFHSDIQSLKNKGQSIPASERNFFEPRFSADFSQVRLHNDSDSAQMARAINARAFTIGTDIVFARGEYSPDSISGRKLLAHELTHVLQQSGTKAANITHCNEPGNRVQRDFAVEPGNPVTEASQLSETEIASAIRYNRARFFDESELRIMRDVLGISEEPAVIDQNFVLAVARYQQQFGETIDGKVGRDSALTLSRELHSESSLVGSLVRPARELGIRGRSTETANNVDSGGRTDIFDASLDHSNARLTLAMRVNFNYVNGGGGAWPNAAAQTTWQNDFIRRVQNRWSYKFLMRRQGHSRRYLRFYASRVNVRASNASPHYTANVSFETAHAGSSVSGGANTATLDSMDTTMRNRIRHGHSYDQRGASHEFGHMLGLDHIACANNSDACYGGASQAVRRNIMGSGSRVTTDNATPFTDAMRTITGQNWTAIMYRTLT